MQGFLGTDGFSVDWFGRGTGDVKGHRRIVAVVGKSFFRADRGRRRGPCRADLSHQGRSLGDGWIVQG
jgi:hypothetical protein